MKKICIIISTFTAGGIENYVLRYLKFIKNIENYTILARTSIKGDLYQEYLNTGVDIAILPLGYFNPINALKYIQYFKKKKFDTVCDFNANFAGSTIFLASLVGINKRVSFYRQGSNHFKPTFIKNQVNKIHNKLVYKNSTHILANSLSALDYFFPYRKSSDKRFQVVYNGIKVDQYNISENKNEIRNELGIPLDKFVLGHVGRNDNLKNHDSIFKVFKRLLDYDNSFFLVLCGSGTEKFENKINEFEISKNVLLLGYRSDVPKVLKALDCFYFPSFSEGQPNALIEAMLSNLPIVCSNIKPILECIPEEAKRYTFDPLAHDNQYKLIKKIYVENKSFDYKTFAAKRYDATNQFNIFEKILNN